METKNQFSTFDIKKLFGISRSNLQQYMDRGLIVPSIERADGRGTRNLFSRDDLFQFLLFKKLHQVGLTQREAAEHCRSVHFDKIRKNGIDYVVIAREEGQIKIIHTHLGGLQARVAHGPSDILILVNAKKIKEQVKKLVG